MALSARSVRDIFFSLESTVTGSVAIKTAVRGPSGDQYHRAALWGDPEVAGNPYRCRGCLGASFGETGCQERATGPGLTVGGIAFSSSMGAIPWSAALEGIPRIDFDRFL